MRVFYGTDDKNIDITNVLYKSYLTDRTIKIPQDDNVRARIFTDPCFGIVKKIYVYIDEKIHEYSDNEVVFIDIDTEEIYTEEIKINNKDVINIDMSNTPTINGKLEDELSEFHRTFRLKYGSFQDELSEQRMALRYLKGHEKVLEIGGNIGRNSLLISYILEKKQNSNFVTLECDPDIAKKLEENRNLNSKHFFIETAALSKRNLIQKMITCMENNTTIESDVLLDGYKPVKTITWTDFCRKYKIEFDTLILDCEGAFYIILKDMPEMLDNIKLIIMENDYQTIEPKNYIDGVLKSKGFRVDYTESGGWGPCYSNFFEVWVR